MSQSHDQIEVRPCAEADALAFRNLRLEALRSHPEAFSADYATNEQAAKTFWADRISRNIGSSDQVIFFAVADGDLVGMTGIFRGDSPKTRHGATIWGVYVRPAWRGRQVAQRLLDACIGWAQSQQLRLLRLAVVTTNLAAIRCYARSGFSVYGVEPQALIHAGRSYDELLMVRHLEPRATSPANDPDPQPEP